MWLRGIGEDIAAKRELSLSLYLIPTKAEAEERSAEQS